MSLAERIRDIRGEMSSSEFCKILNIHRNTLYGYESGERTPNADLLEAICILFKVDPSWLLLGVGDRKNSTGDNFSFDEFDYIPMAKATLSAGGGAFVLSEDFEGYYAFRKSWVNSITSSKNGLVLMKVIGNSMYPTIQSRDTVMIDTNRLNIKEGEIYALRADSTVMIKRISFRPENKVMIISDNKNEFPAYDAEIKDIHILGQVIFFSRVLIHE